MDRRIGVILAPRDEAVTDRSHFFLARYSVKNIAGVRGSFDLDQETVLDCSIASRAS